MKKLKIKTIVRNQELIVLKIIKQTHIHNKFGDKGITGYKKSFDRKNAFIAKNGIIFASELVPEFKVLPENIIVFFKGTSVCEHKQFELRSPLTKKTIIKCMMCGYTSIQGKFFSKDLIVISFSNLKEIYKDNFKTILVFSQIENRVFKAVKEYNEYFS